MTARDKSEDNAMVECMRFRGGGARLRRMGRSSDKARLQAEARTFSGAASRSSRRQGERPSGWLPDDVRRVLAETMRTLAIVVPRVGPREFGNSMPRPLQENLNLAEGIEALKDADLYKLENTIRLCAYSAEVARAETAMYWPGKYLVGEGDWSGPNRVLRLWLNCMARKRCWRRVYQAAGYPKTTVALALDKAFSIIATGLNRDGVRIGDKPWG